MQAVPLPVFNHNHNHNHSNPSSPRTHPKTYLHTDSESPHYAYQANVRLALEVGAGSALVSSSLVYGYYIVFYMCNI